MKAEAIKGMAVVSITDGAKLGRVDDLVFDTERRRVAALRISAEGQQAVIPMDKVQSIGSDAITVPSNEVTQWGSSQHRFAGLPRLDDLGKLKVVDEAGTLLGTVHEVDFDPQTGAITEVQVRKGGVLGIGGTTHRIAADDIASVGNEVMVVKGV